jgi:hypothetical protein
VPKLNCRCGETLSYGEIPSPIEWKIISDVAFDRFTGMVNAEEVYAAMESALRCPRCNRLWVFWDGFQSDPQEYTMPGTRTPNVP